ncbi:MAG TPA: VOC family protein [Acidimicrobiia bacterium]|nr:VOC family protein [Acidimicrobiia bacterium]
MTVPARVSLVTLGVADLARSTAFYASLGWRLGADSNDSVTFLHTSGPVVALYPLTALAADAHLRPERSGFSGVTLAINVGSPEEVDAALTAAAEAGATILKPAEHVFWGGYSGYFADPDGHAWEVAHNPGWPIGPDGRPVISA